MEYIKYEHVLVYGQIQQIYWHPNQSPHNKIMGGGIPSPPPPYLLLASAENQPSVRCWSDIGTQIQTHN